MSKSNVKASKNTPKTTRSGNWLWPAGIFLLSFLLYSNSIQNFYALDDDIYTRKNEYVKQGFSALPQIFKQGSLMGFNKQNDANYRPVVLLDFMIETAIFKENPYVNHFFNVFFWAISNVILYWFLLRLFRNYNRLVPLLISVLYILHPIHTDVVANIKSRDELLGFLFGISCLLQVLKFTDTQDRKYAIYAALLFFLSVLCKENSVTLIVIIPVMIYTFREEVSIKKALMYSLPFAGMLVVYFSIRLNVLSSVTFKDNKIDVVNNSLMAATNVWDMYATNFSMMGRYLRLVFFPYPLSWDYSYNTFPVVSWSSYQAWFPGLVYLAMIVYAAVRVWKRDVFAFCIIFYLSTLILTSNLIVKILATFAERFLFLPSLGFCIAIVFLLFRLTRTDLKASRLEIPSNLRLVFGAIMALYAIEVLTRVPDWKDNTHLFEAGLSTQPNSARAHFAVASESRSKGEAEGNPVVKDQELQKALTEYQRGLKIWDQDAEIYFNMGITYAAMGQKDKAIEYYNKTLALRPSYGGARNNLGVFYFNDRDYPKALECFQGILKYDSLYSDAYSNIGATYENTGRHKEALEYFAKAARLNKDSYGAYENMARSSMAMHDSAAARDYTASANLIRERLSKIKPAFSPADYSFKPVVFLVLLTFAGLIILVYRASKEAV
ncbi:MAG TPA: tetratricopeptide repeat protein [Bacteroidia bacterium]|jgi:tetratricopeptide (TPR) repeat protein|nr:tetratricopeptide repeat protein [Bacteroidia bacterium]